MESDTKYAPKRKSLKRPPDYSSLSVRLRMASLVTALGIVILAMNQARKPEFWENMGFAGSGTELQSNQDLNDSVSNAQQDEKPNVELEFENWLTAQTEKLGPIEIETLASVINYPSSRTQASNRSPEQFALLLEKLANESNSDFSDETSKILTKLNAAEQKKPLGESELVQLNTISKVAMERAFEFVEDRTSMNRSSERAAWNSSWRSMEIHTDENADAVSYLQLVGQPEAYRGKLIRVDGEIRGVEKIELDADHPLGFDAYFVLWIKPDDSGHTPYCVYSNKLPNGIENPADRFDTLKKPAEITGRFFKLRSYEATNNKVEVCPLIIASSIQLKPDFSVARSTSWKPPVWMWLLFFVTIPIAAALMAIGVYQSTKTKRRKHDDSLVSQSLGTLSRHTGIKSDLDNIRDLGSSDSKASQ